MSEIPTKQLVKHLRSQGLRGIAIYAVINKCGRSLKEFEELRAKIASNEIDPQTWYNVGKKTCEMLKRWAGHPATCPYCLQAWPKTSPQNVPNKSHE